MALTNLSQITTSGIATLTDINLNNITGVAATFTGNVTVGGTLTYDDVTNIDSVGLITARSGIRVLTGTATTALVVEGDARITGILTVGTSSLTLDGTNNIVNVGTALTLGHTQGIQFHTQNLHSQGFEVNNVNATGIVTATSGIDITNGYFSLYSPTGQSIRLRTDRGTIGELVNVSGDGTIRLYTGEVNPVLRTNISAYGDTYFNGNSGKVGIGLTNPDEELTVVGTIKAVGSSDPSIRVSSTNTAYNGSMRLNTTNNTLEFFTRYAGTYYTNNLVLKQGKVGIGLTNPDKDLTIASARPTIKFIDSDVANNAAFATIDASSHGGILFDADPNDVRSGTDFRFNIDGDEKLRITSGGLVGIGTDDPARSLDVRGGDSTDVVQFSNDSGNKVTFGVSSTQVSIDLLASKSFRIRSGSTERLHITSGGNVRVPDNGKFTAGAGDDLQIYHNGTHSYIADEGSGELIISGSRIQLMNAARAEKAIDFVQSGAVDIYYNGNKKLETKSDGVDINGELQCDTLDVDGASSFTVSGSGNQDVADFNNGTNGGGTRVKVRCVANQGGDPFIFFDSGGTNFVIGEKWYGTSNNIMRLGAGNDMSTVSGITISSAGLVGIGNDNPTVQLDVKRSTAGTIAKFYDTGSNGGALYNGGPILGLSRISNGNVSLGGLLFQVGIDKSNSSSYNVDETIFSVTNSGVGIGTDNPSSTYLLEVDGPIRSGVSGSSLPKGAGFRQHAVCSAGLGNRLIYNAFDAYYAEKSFSHYFSNGQSNRALRIHSNRNSWWTCGFITIHAQYSNANASGMLRYEFTHNANGTSNYGKTIDVNVNRGSTSGHFGMSNNYSFKTWGSNGGSTTSHALEIRHLTSSGNGCYVTIELYGTSAATYIDDLYMTTGHTY